MKYSSRRRTHSRGIALLGLVCGVLAFQPTWAHAGDVPALPSSVPEGFAMAAFENRTGSATYDWLTAALPVYLAGKLEKIATARPVYDAWVVRAPTPVSVSQIAQLAHGGRWVWGGSFRRLANWKLELTVDLWRLEGGRGVHVGREIQVGAFDDFRRLAGVAMGALATRARFPVAGSVAALADVGAGDPYAWTLLGRAVRSVFDLDFPGAEAQLRRALFIDPTLATAHRLLGECARRVGQNKAAGRHYATAAAIDPSDMAAVVGRAEFALLLGESHDAVVNARRAVQLRPSDLRARSLYARALWSDGLAAESERELRELLRVAPADIAARRALVAIYASRGDKTATVRELEQLTNFATDDPQVHLELAAQYRSVGQRDKAIASYRKLLERFPNHGDAWKQLGDVYRESSMLTQSIDAYRNAVAHKPNDARAYFLLGAAYVAVGDDKAARTIYRAATAFEAHRIEAYNNLGAIAYRQDDFSSALWYLRQAVDSRPKEVKYRYNYALALSAAKRLDDASEQVAAALRLAPSDPELLYLEGVVALRKGDVDAAEQAFLRALAKNPRLDDARHNLQLLAQLKQRSDHKNN